MRDGARCRAHVAAITVTNPHCVLDDTLSLRSNTYSDLRLPNSYENSPSTSAAAANGSVIATINVSNNDNDTSSHHSRSPLVKQEASSSRSHSNVSRGRGNVSGAATRIFIFRCSALLDLIGILCYFHTQSAGAQDLRVKLETAFAANGGPSGGAGQASSSTSSSQAAAAAAAACLSSMSTPTALANFIEKNSGDSTLTASLAASIAPADMLNVWNATKLNQKGGTVNTADGELPNGGWVKVQILVKS